METQNSSTRMNMERSAGPRVYVPINMPDHTNQPTYAVLELVGFSCPMPPSAGPHLLQSPALIASPSPSPHPAMLCLPPAPSSSPPPAAMEAMDTATGPTPSYYALPGPGPLRPASISAPPLLSISHFPADSSGLLLPSPLHLLHPPPHHHQQSHYLHARPYAPPAPRLEVVNLESPPSSPSSLAPSSASSASRESSKEKHSGSSAPATGRQALPAGNASGATPIVRFTPSISDASSAFVNGSSSRPAANFSSSMEGPHLCSLSMPRAKLGQITERDVTPTKISVSQTERETIVHTHSSNFRDVVRQLTGASSEDQNLLPITLPARLANRVSNASIVQNQSTGCKDLVVNGGGPSSRDQLGLRKAPLKLHERRKSTMKNLEKVSSAYSLYGAAEVSPIMNPSPVTPLVSDFERCCNASTPTSQGSSGLSSPIPLLDMGKAAAENMAGRVGEDDQQQESGCLFSLPCPLAGERPPSSPLEKPIAPTLLSLFPESPSCSPRDRELHI